MTDFLGNRNGNYASGALVNQTPLSANDAGSVSFNGTTARAYLYIPTTDALFGNANGFSCSVVFKASALTTTQVPILSTYNDAQNYFQILVSSQYFVFQGRVGGTFFQAYGTFNPVVGTVYSGVVVADPVANKFTAYLAGVAGGTTSAPYLALAPISTIVLAVEPPAFTNFYSGTLAELAFYPYALSAAQVGTLNTAVAVVGSTTVKPALTPVQSPSNPFISITGYSRNLNQTVYTAGASADTGGTSQQVYKMQVRSNRIRVVFGNFTSSNNGESATSPLTIQASIQSVADNDTPVQLTFGGANSVAIQTGQIIYSDWYAVPGFVEVGQFIAIRTFATWAASASVATSSPGPSFSNTGYLGAAGDNYPQHTTGAGTNQILTAGKASVWASSTTTTSYQPMGIDGYAVDGVARPNVALVGDSILNGFTDAPDGTGGYGVRAMISLGLPYILCAQPGESCASVVTSAGFASRLTRISRATCIIHQYGTNDINGNVVTFATLRANTLLFWQLLAANGAQVIPVTLIPRITGTATPAASQTVNTNAAVYQSYNAWLRSPISGGANVSARFDAAAVGVTVPTIIDAAAYIETDSVNTAPNLVTPNTGNRLYCGAGNATAYTSDGTHPTTAGALIMVPAFTTMAVKAAIFATVPTSPSGLRFARRM